MAGQFWTEDKVYEAVEALNTNSRVTALDMLSTLWNREINMNMLSKACQRWLKVPLNSLLQEQVDEAEEKDATEEEPLVGRQPTKEEQQAEVVNRIIDSVSKHVQALPSVAIPMIVEHRD